MKVSYNEKVRKFNSFPRDMAEMRRVVQRKFTANRQSEVGNGNFIEWDKQVCFYYDSEGDFNVLSVDDDLRDASIYFT